MSAFDSGLQCLKSIGVWDYSGQDMAYIIRAPACFENLWEESGVALL